MLRHSDSALKDIWKLPPSIIPIHRDYILVLRATGRLFVSRIVAQHRDFHVTILGANGVGDRYPSSSSHVPYNHEETVSNCAALRLAKCSQHSADQLPYDKSPIEPFQSIFHERWSSKLYFPPRCRDRNTSGASPVYRCMPSVRGSGLSGSRQTSPIKQRLDGLRNWWETDLVN